MKKERERAHPVLKFKGKKGSISLRKKKRENRSKLGDVLLPKGGRAENTQKKKKRGFNRTRENGALAGNRITWGDYRKEKSPHSNPF